MNVQKVRSIFPSTLIALIILLFILSVSLCPVIDAQSTALLNGTVSDASGAAVPSAKVILRNAATSEEWNTQTNGAGLYVFPSLPPGNYQITVTQAGFQTLIVTDLRLDVATSVTKDLQLSVGSVSQQVQVTTEAPLIETSTTGVGQVINSKTVQEIPLNGRHFVDLNLLTPGTVTPPANGFLTAPLRGQGSFAINTAGQREDTTNWLVNGINLNDPVQNQVTFQPPLDTLEEFKVDNSTFPAQYGRNAGAIVNIATRSGTNEYHGEAFEFFRNNALDARNYFNAVGTPQAPFKHNEFGGDFGGPIKKNKVFFFLAYEGIRQHQGLTLGAIVPSQNQIATVTSPAVLSLLKLIPAANNQGSDKTGIPANFNGFSGAALANVSLNQGSGDIDVQLRQSDQLHFYYVMQKDLREEPTQGGAAAANIPGFGDTRNGFRQLMTIGEDHVFSPSLANTIRLGYNRIHLIFTPTALNPADFDIGLPPGAPVGVGIPNINVSGDMDFGGPTAEPQGRGDTTVVVNDTLSWLKDRHSMAFGGEIRRAYNNNIAENVGSFTYPTMTDFLADEASAFTVLLGAGNDRILQPSYGVFAQDSFKWRPNFTINFGLRYEWDSTPSEALARFTNFDLPTGTLIPASHPFHTNNKNFEPRVGFAWDPFKNGKTSIRAAYAILSQDPTTNIVSPLSGNPPFAVPVSVNSATNAITLENPSASIVGLSLGPSAIDPNFDNMYAQDWNLTVERELTPSLGLEVAYVGLKATHLQMTGNFNQPFVRDGFYIDTRPYTTLPLTSAVLPAQCAAPNPPCAVGNITRIFSPGNSNYNALWVTLNKHLSHGFQFLAAYTYSHSLDYSSVSSGDAVPVQNVYNPRGDYASSEFDTRNRIVVSGFYQLPFQGNRLVAGWQFGVVTMAQNGNPITPLLIIGPAPGSSLTVRPDQLRAVSGTGRPAQFYSNTLLCQPFAAPFTGEAPAIPDCADVTNPTYAVPCTFSATPENPTPGAPGNNVYPIVPGSCHPGSAGRDSLPGPAFVNTDFSIVKNTKITERFNLQFRTEMFDVFNHPNFGDPVNTVTSSAFGKILSTRFPVGDFGSARQIQFALKLLF
ncbi:MAG TPA: TonB-dependent receptor [Terriglobales bacterium]|nr:TonB-dependent receptor [Terriglobales bacterium]